MLLIPFFTVEKLVFKISLSVSLLKSHKNGVLIVFICYATTYVSVDWTHTDSNVENAHSWNKSL